jgi:predicted nuclease of predicted toxin-antitoxin system
LPDADILQKAHSEKRVLLTHDLDLGELIAASGSRLPSVVIFRLRNMQPERVSHHLQAVISQHRQAMEQGSIISVTEGQTRVRMLPISLDG